MKKISLLSLLLVASCGENPDANNGDTAEPTKKIVQPQRHSAPPRGMKNVKKPAVLIDRPAPLSTEVYAAIADFKGKTLIAEKNELLNALAAFSGGTLKDEHGDAKDRDINNAVQRIPALAGIQMQIFKAIGQLTPKSPKMSDAVYNEIRQFGGEHLLIASKNLFLFFLLLHLEDNQDPSRDARIIESEGPKLRGLGNKVVALLPPVLRADFTFFNRAIYQ